MSVSFVASRAQDPGITKAEIIARNPVDAITGKPFFNDVLIVLAAWGNKGGPEDLDGSGFVDIGDILAVLAAWGPCPSS